MPCCHLTRRQVLRWAAIAGSTTLLPVVDPERTYAAGATGGVPMNTEIVTLTETGVVITWYSGVPGFTGDALRPTPMDTELRIGTSPLRLRTVLHRSRRTPYHYAEIHGLEPGRTYYYQALSDGVPALPASNAQGNPLGIAATTMSGLRGLSDVFAFTTPQPPPGRHLFTLALANDVHMGETVAGLIKTLPNGSQVPPGITQVPGEPPYAEVMCEAMVDDARERGADRLLVAGDLTSEAKPVDLHRCLHYLQRFGRYRDKVFVARGNHDRAHAGAAYAACSASTVDPGKRDCFKDVFDSGEPTWFATTVDGLRIVALDTYDKAGNGGDNGGLSAAQWSWLRHELARDRDRPTLVFGHHPVTLASDVVNDEPLVFDLALAQSRRLESMYAETPGVFFHHAGHTHRNYRSASTVAKRVTFQEVGATKEYPGGFSLLRVHEGGYAMNFYKTRSDLAREWSERTRGEYAGVGASAFYMTGSIGDRNYVVTRDLSGLTAPARHPNHAHEPSPSPSPSPGARRSASAAAAGGALADTGPGTGPAELLLAGGAVAGAAALAARARHDGSDGTP